MVQRLVWEKHYSTFPLIDPKGPGNGAYRVIRGGSWKDGAVACQSALAPGELRGQEELCRL